MLEIKLIKDIIVIITFSHNSNNINIFCQLSYFLIRVILIDFL